MSVRHGSPAPAVDIADDTFVSAPVSVVAPVVGDPARWAEWWPDLELVVSRDRGSKGRQWAVGGRLRGSMEIWLEAVPGGTVVHWFLRATPAGPRPRGGADRLREQRVLAWKAHMFVLKDRLEQVKNASRPADQALG